MNTSFAINNIFQRKSGSKLDYAQVVNNTPVPRVEGLPMVETERRGRSNALDSIQELGQCLTQVWSKHGMPALIDGVAEFSTTHSLGTEDGRLVEDPRNLIFNRTLTLDFRYDSEAAGRMTIVPGGSVCGTGVGVNFKARKILFDETASTNALHDIFGFKREDHDVGYHQCQLLANQFKKATAMSDHTRLLVAAELHSNALKLNRLMGGGGNPVEIQNYVEPEYEQYSQQGLLTVLVEERMPIRCTDPKDADLVRFLQAIASEYPFFDWEGEENIYRSVRLEQTKLVKLVGLERTAVRANGHAMFTDPEAWDALTATYVSALGIEDEHEIAREIALMCVYAKPDAHNCHVITMNQPNTYIDMFLMATEAAVLIKEYRAYGWMGVEHIIGAQCADILANGAIRGLHEKVGMHATGSTQLMRRHVQQVRERVANDGIAIYHGLGQGLCGPWTDALVRTRHFEGMSMDEYRICVVEDIRFREVCDLYTGVLERTSLVGLTRYTVPPLDRIRNAADKEVSDFYSYASILCADAGDQVVGPDGNYGLRHGRMPIGEIDMFAGKLVIHRIVKREFVSTRIAMHHAAYEMLDNVCPDDDYDYSLFMPRVYKDAEPPTPAPEAVRRPRTATQNRRKERREVVRQAPMPAAVPVEAVEVKRTVSKTRNGPTPVVAVPPIVGTIEEWFAKPRFTTFMAIMKAPGGKGYDAVRSDTVPKTRGKVDVGYLDHSLELVSIDEVTGWAEDLVRRSAVEDECPNAREAMALAEGIHAIMAGIDPRTFVSIFRKAKRVLLQRTVVTELQAADTVGVPHKAEKRIRIGKVGDMLTPATEDQLEKLAEGRWARQDVGGGGDCGPAALRWALAHNAVTSYEATNKELRELYGAAEKAGDTRRSGVWWSLATMERAADTLKCNLVLLSDTAGHEQITIWHGAGRPTLALGLYDGHFYALEPLGDEDYGIEELGCELNLNSLSVGKKSAYRAWQQMVLARIKFLEDQGELEFDEEYYAPDIWRDGDELQSEVVEDKHYARLKASVIGETLMQLPEWRPSKLVTPAPVLVARFRIACDNEIGAVTSLLRYGDDGINQELARIYGSSTTTLNARVA